MHSQNCFITLTYNDEHLGDNRLDYRDFQLFMKKLRKLTNNKIGFHAVGEYGEKSKRKHWHAIIFGWEPADKKKIETTNLGHDRFDSETLKKLWPYGLSDVGSVTMQSAGYVSRYNAKKLVHGNDGSHEYDPISKKSNKQAIGKAWIEKYYQDVFNTGSVRLLDGTAISIPRYYEKWFKENKPTEWLAYVTHQKAEKTARASARASSEQSKLYDQITKRGLMGAPTSALEARRQITKAKFKMLQEKLKL